MSVDASRSDRTQAWIRGHTYGLAGVAVFVLGVVAGLLALVGPLVQYRRLLIAFAGVGVFAGVLLTLLRPGATADTDPTEHVYSALSTNAEALAQDAGLGDRWIYAPTSFETDGFAPVALTIPAADSQRISIDRNRRPVFDQARGTLPSDPAVVTLHPTGAALFEAFEEMTVSALSGDPVELADQLQAGVVVGLELADAVEVDVDPADGTARVTVDRPRFGPATRFDHPVTSFLAVGFAVGLDVPVVVEREKLPTAETYRITCQWAPEKVGS